MVYRVQKGEETFCGTDYFAADLSSQELVFRLLFHNVVQYLPHPGNHGNDQRIAHTEEPHPLRHTSVGPVIVESL